MCHCGNIQSFKFPEHLHTLCSLSSPACPSTVTWAHKAHVPAGPFTCHLLLGRAGAPRSQLSSRAKLGLLEVTASVKESLNRLIYTCKYLRRRAGAALFSTKTSWVLQPRDTKSTTMHQDLLCILRMEMSSD